MKIKGRFILFLLLFSLQTTVSAQYYDIGQAPASIRWEKIETGNFSIIYPSSYYEKAKEIAFHFSSADTTVSSGLKSHPKHTPLILHPHNPISNAYAIWAPRRIELLTIPPQDLYPQPWIQQLALHEYRHIVQLSSLNQGFTKVLGYILGQQAAAVSTGLFVPPWFLEGDAVVSETALSNSGRGRVASFSQPLRAQLTEKGAYSFPKASLGSYRDFVPDIYIAGYHIVAASRQKYGPQLWTEAMNSVARRPWTITPFNYGLKKISGLNKKGLYLETIKKLDSMWNKVHSDSASQIFLSADPVGFTNYLHPHRINDSTIIALKTSFRFTPKIISLDLSGNEKVIHNPGYIMNELVSYNGGYVAWAEYKPHIRWETAGYTEIVLLDPLNGNTERLKVKGKFYAPEVSPDGNYVAAVEYTDSGTGFISIIEVLSGTLKRFELPAGIHAATPSWSRDGRNLVFIATGSQGKTIAMISADNGVIDYLTTFSYEEISNPAFIGNDIAYTGTYQENNQIFSFNPDNGQLRKLTDVNYGADQVSFWGDSLLIAEYTANGYRISVLSADRESNKMLTGKVLNNWPLAEALSDQESRFRLTDTPDLEYKRIPYRKAANLFGLHSWAPIYIDIGGETARPGVSLMSQNLLSTMFVTAGYDYNMQEEAGMFRADVSWKGWFPVLTASAAKGNRASSYSAGEDQPPQRFTWKETNFDLSVSQNLNLSGGPYISGIFAETGFNYSNITHDISTPEDFTEGDLTGLSYRLFGYIYQRQAYRDLAPRFGVNFDTRFKHTPFGQIKAGSITALQTQLFLPGIVVNHSLSFYGGIQKSDPEEYRFSNIISTSRGYTTMANGNDMLSLKFAYRLPLIYPDLHLGGLLYIKRIRANFFYDMTRISDPDPYTYYNSSGIELLADLHLFGLSSPVSSGIRATYLERSGTFTYNFLFSIDFYQY